MQELLKEVKTRNIEWRDKNHPPRTKKYMVIDYEGMSNKRPYNVGIVIGDKNKKYYQTSIIFPQYIGENLTGTNLTAIAMASEIQALANNPAHAHEFKRTTAEEFGKLMVTLIDRYQIKEIWAYNVTFDKNATKRLFAHVPKYWKYLEETVTWCDIQREVFFTRLNTKKYIKWCIANNYLTPAGNIQTKEETVYRYLFQDSQYEEKHIGVYDALDEFQILLVALRDKQKRQKQEKGTPLYLLLNRTMERLGM